MASDKNYLDRLDIIRGIGALLVVYRHFFDSFLPSFNTPKWPFGLSIVAEGGGLGVALFCVVSGFIFEYLVRGRRIKYWAFVQARLWRIYPLYVLVLVMGTLAIKGSLLNAVLQMFLLIPTANPGINFGQVWSIAIEFQFYLVFPFLSIILLRSGIRQLGLLLAFIVVMRALLWYQGVDVNDLGYWSMVGRIDQFLCGMIAAKLYYEGRAGRFANWGAFLGSLLFVAVVAHFYHNIYGAAYPWHQQPMKHWYGIVWPTVQAIGFAGVVLSFLSLPCVIPRMIERPLLFMGTISYSLYIVHRLVEQILAVKVLNWRLPVMTAIPKLDAILFCTFVEVPLVVALAALTYYAIEKPFQQFKRSYTIPEEEPQEQHRGMRVVGSK